MPLLIFAMTMMNYDTIWVDMAVFRQHTYWVRFLAGCQNRQIQVFVTFFAILTPPRNLNELLCRLSKCCLIVLQFIKVMSKIDNGIKSTTTTDQI